MANAYVQLPSDGPGKKIQTFENTVSANSVHANGVVLVKSDGTALDPVTGIGSPTAGDIAHDAADSGAPVKIGGYASSSAPTSVAGGDRVNAWFDLAGRQAVFIDAAASTIAKAEDAAHASGDVGVPAWAVRNDTHTAALSGTDGDYTPLAVDSTGKLGVRGTYAEDAAHTTGDLGHFVLAVRNDTISNALSGTDGDYTPIAVDSAGRIGLRGMKASDDAWASTDAGLFILAVRNDSLASVTSNNSDLSYLSCDTYGRLEVVNTSRTKAVAFSFTSPSSATTAPQTAVTDLGYYRSCQLYCSFQGATGGTLDIYLQYSPDGGSTWVDYAHFAQIAAGASAIHRTISFSKSTPTSSVSTVGINSSPALAADTFVGGDWGDRMRVVAVSGAGTSAGAVQTMLAVFSS